MPNYAVLTLCKQKLDLQEDIGSISPLLDDVVGCVCDVHQETALQFPTIHLCVNTLPLKLQ